MNEIVDVFNLDTPIYIEGIGTLGEAASTTLDFGNNEVCDLVTPTETEWSFSCEEVNVKPILEAMRPSCRVEIIFKDGMAMRGDCSIKPKFTELGVQYDATMSNLSIMSLSLAEDMDRIIATYGKRRKLIQVRKPNRTRRRQRLTRLQRRAKRQKK